MQTSKLDPPYYVEEVIQISEIPEVFDGLVLHWERDDHFKVYHACRVRSIVR